MTDLFISFRDTSSMHPISHLPRNAFHAASLDRTYPCHINTRIFSDLRIRIYQGARTYAYRASATAWPPAGGSLFASRPDYTPAWRYCGPRSCRGNAALEVIILHSVPTTGTGMTAEGSLRAIEKISVWLCNFGTKTSVIEFGYKDT